MEFVKTTRGGQRLLYEGYAYIMDRKQNSLTYWRCEKKECTSRLTTENNNLKNPLPVHSHLPDPGRIAVHGRVQNDLPCTNNSIEGWHKAFDQRVGITHPTIRRLVNKIRKEQANNEIILGQLSAGVSVGPPKKRYQALNMRLKEIVGDLDLNIKQNIIRRSAS